MKQIILVAILTLVFSVSFFAQTEKSACPTIEVVGGGVVKPGEPMSFSVKSSDDTKNLKFEYEWTVSAGTISSGQGTSSITIDTTGLSDQNITAEVKTKGLPENCANTASETGSVAPRLIGDPLDNFGKLPNDEVKARIDALFIALNNYPSSQGQIIIYGTDQEIADRVKQIQKAINFLKYDAKLVTITKCGANPNGGVWTTVWIVPPGAELL